MGYLATKSSPHKGRLVQSDIDSDREGHMEAKPSPFSRPPQPRPTSSFTTAVVAPREASVGGATSAAPSEERAALERQRRSGGQWFYWIGGLSLINAAIAFAGQDWRFILGLGVTQLVQALAKDGDGIKAGLVSVGVIAIFLVLGQRAVQGAGWAFLLGMILFALDGGIFVIIRDWVGVGFHAFAVAMIGRGYMAARRLSPGA
jgi:hypothetical protein